MKIIKLPIIAVVLLLIFIVNTYAQDENSQIKNEVNNKILPTKYHDASKFIFNLNNEELVSKFDYQISGVFKAKKIRNWIESGKTSGIMFWFGVREGEEKPFLSFERKGKRFRFCNEDMMYYLPNRPWKHPIGIRTIQNIEEFDKNALESIEKIEVEIREKNQKPEKRLKRTDSSHQRKMKDNFKAIVKDKKTETLGFTFFSLLQDNGGSIKDKKGKYWNLFFEQGDVRFIRYYLGFNEEKDGNPICMILVPVNENGKNFSKDDLNDEAKDFLNEEPMLLEFSWPPKPSGQD